MRSVSKLRLTVLVAGSMLAVCLAPAAAQAGWTPSQPVIGTGPDTTNTRIAGNTGSQPLVVWTRPVLGLSTVQAARLNDDGTSGPVLTLSSPLQNAESPVVSVSPNGTAAVAWVVTSGVNKVVQSVTVSTSNVVSAVGNRSEAGPLGQDATGPRVAIKDDGTMAVTWRKFNGTTFDVQARVVTAAGTATDIRTFPGIFFQNTDFPDVAALPDGTFRLLWGVGTGPLGNVATNTLSADGTAPAEPTYVFPTTELSEEGETVFTGAPGAPAGARLVPFTNGATVFGWLRDIPVDPEVPGSAVRSVEGGGVSSLGAVTGTSRVSSTAFDVSQFSLAQSATQAGTANGGNSAIGAWTTEVPGNRQIQASRLKPGGLAGSPATLSGDVGTEGFPEPALSLQNWGTVAWFESTGNPGITTAKVGRVSPGGLQPTPVQDLTTGSLTSTDNPQVVMGADDVPTVAFDAVDGATLNSNFARFSDPGGAAVSPSVLVFNSQILNVKTKSRAVFLTSNGSTANRVQGVSVTGPSASQFPLKGGSDCVPVIQPGTTCSVGLNFRPTSAGSKNATVTLQTDSGPISAGIKGFGLARTRVSFKVKPKNRAQRRGKVKKVTAKLNNFGGIAAKGVKICAYGDKGFVRPKKRCIKVGSVAAGKTVKRSFGLRLTGRAKKGKKYAVNFRLKSGNANKRRETVRLRLKG